MANQDNQENLVENMGGCICTKSILSGETRLLWCYREESIHPSDSGWRFVGESDTEEFINQPENNCVVELNTIANIEPAVQAIYNMPVGTDLYLNRDTNGNIHFMDMVAKKEIFPEY